MYEWTEDLSVGVETIDSQHRELFRAFNKLLRNGESASSEEVPWVLGFLEDYVMSHFGMEELYMRRLSYPGYVGHKNAHMEFIDNFYDFRDELDASGSTPEAADRMGRFLGDWLTNHIGQVDRALGEFMRRKDGRIA